MEETKREHIISIEEAINLTSGNRKYQKRTLFILMLSSIAMSPIDMCSQFFLPAPSLVKTNYYEKSATNDFNIEYDEQTVSFNNYYSLGKAIGCFIIPLLMDRYGRKKYLSTVAYYALIFIYF